MKKNIKIGIIVVSTLLMIVSWAAIFFSNTRSTKINYWWQAAMAVVAILFGFLGLLTAKHWSWLKSSVGRSVFFVALGVIIWGIGQAGWTYFIFKYPNQESPPSRILDAIDYSALPIWGYGVFMLSKATGAKYGLKKLKGKLLVVGLAAIMIAASYYFLVVLARGGTAYFHQSFANTFFDLGYSIGDAIIFTLSLAIFGLSWKYLGGRFKKPIIAVLVGFGVLYLADFSFAYLDTRGRYFNGSLPDLLYMVMIAIFGLALCLLDPSKLRTRPVTDATAPIPPAPEPMQAPVPPPPTENLSPPSTPSSPLPLEPVINEPNIQPNIIPTEQTLADGSTTDSKIEENS